MFELSYDKILVIHILRRNQWNVKEEIVRYAWEGYLFDAAMGGERPTVTALRAPCSTLLRRL